MSNDQIAEGWDSEAYKSACDGLEYWRSRAEDSENTLERIQNDLSPTHMGEPLLPHPSPQLPVNGAVLFCLNSLINKVEQGIEITPGFIASCRETAARAVDIAVEQRDEGKASPQGLDGWIEDNSDTLFCDLGNEVPNMIYADDLRTYMAGKVLVPIESLADIRECINDGYPGTAIAAIDKMLDGKYNN